MECWISVKTFFLSILTTLYKLSHDKIQNPMRARALINFSWFNSWSIWPLINPLNPELGYYPIHILDQLIHLAGPNWSGLISVSKTAVNLLLVLFNLRDSVFFNGLWKTKSKILQLLIWQLFHFRSQNFFQVQNNCQIELKMASESFWWHSLRLLEERVAFEVSRGGLSLLLGAPRPTQSFNHK